MAEDNDLSERKRIARIEALKEKVIKLAGGDPECLYLNGLNLEIQESFLKQVLFMEGLDEKPLFEQLEKAGLQLIRPEHLKDTALYAKLWETIHSMARMGYYLSNTDHLSDRELYTLLWKDILRQPESVNPDPSKTSCHIDILGGCSEEDLKIRLKYYADEDERSCWEGDFPEDEIPPKEPLPYDRDRHLPVPAESCLHQ
jgi:hypothetical protein